MRIQKEYFMCSQNQAGVCIPVLWAIGQSGKTDLATGIKGKKITFYFLELFRSLGPIYAKRSVLTLSVGFEIIDCVSVLWVVEIFESQIELCHFETNIP